MDSPDGTALWAQITGAPQTYAPGAYGSVYTSPAGTVESVSPFPNSYVPPTSTGDNLQALTKTGFALGAAGRAIGGYRQEKAMGKIAETLARQKAFRLTNEGLKAASRARAVAGAQGRTGAGSPLLAELASVQNAVTDARSALYEGNVAKFESDQRAKKQLYKAPEEILKALLSGSSLFKENT